MMAAPATQEFTLHLPEDVIELLRRAARERSETPDAIVAEALRFSLQPVRQDALRRLKGHIQQQQALSEPEVRAHLAASLTDEEQERLSQLLERNRSEALSTEERAELQTLFDRIEAVATEKAAAIWLSPAGNRPLTPREVGTWLLVSRLTCRAWLERAWKAGAKHTGALELARMRRAERWR